MALLQYYDFNLFIRLLKKSPMMQDAANRSVLALLMINKDTGETGMVVRRSLLKNDKILLNHADIDFTASLLLYNMITRAAMRDILEVAKTSKDAQDFHDHLSPLARCYVSSQVHAAITYYDAALSCVDMVPGLNTDIARQGFTRLRDYRQRWNDIFWSGKLARSSLEIRMPEKKEFSGDATMMWFLCYTDLAWARALFEGIMSTTYRRLLPLTLLTGLVEQMTRGYFRTYASGISKLARIEKLTRREYMTLKMSFMADVFNYYDLSRYYSACNILDKPFFAEMGVLTRAITPFLWNLEVTKP